MCPRSELQLLEAASQLGSAVATQKTNEIGSRWPGTAFTAPGAQAINQAEEVARHPQLEARKHYGPTGGEFMVGPRQFDQSPIIIGGCPRSGTSLLLSILSAHPHIYAVPDEMWSFWPTTTTDEFKILISNLEDKINQLKIPLTVRRWCEKTPNNLMVFDRLLECLAPHIKLFNIVRDGRDVITSKHPQDDSRFWVTIEQWVAEVSFGLQFENHPQVFTVRYEDLVLDFEREAKNICHFLEEEDPTPILSWYNHATIRSHSAWPGQLRPIFNHSIARWKSRQHDKLIHEFMKNKEAIRLLEHFHYAG